jgi:hypothetical protein
MPAPLFSGAAGRCVERRIDDWLLIDCEFDVGPQNDPAMEPPLSRLLAWNAMLDGGVKFVITADRRIGVHAEMPWGEDRESPDAATAVAAGINQSHRLLREAGAPAGACPLPAVVAPSEDLLRVCADSGWTVHTRPDSRVLIELDASCAGRWQARILPLPTQGTLVLVEVAVFDPASAAAREAVSLLLLLAGAAVRWARPVMRLIDGRVVAAFEVILPLEPVPGAIADALSALSIACQLAGAAASALLQEPACRDYLKVIGTISGPNINIQRETDHHGTKQHS